MDFIKAFKVSTGYEPYPWQVTLYKELAAGNIPENLSMPTGTGKTSIIPVWLIALAQNPALPRRLVYVVDRRSVVDQATKVVEQLVERLPSVPELTSYLGGLSLEGEALLGVSTLRGEYQDNQEWSKFPFRPAVVVGTVDMVGSRLLFSGYGDGAYSRSLHAGLLGNDTLVVFDECHLVPAFENLLRMVKEAEGKLKPFHVLTMSATSNGEGSITLSEADLANTTINAKLTAHKALQLRDVAKPVPFIIKQALDNPPDRTIVFVNSPRVAAEIAAEIQKHCSKVAALTGTIRGKERDDLVDNPIFQTFTKAEKPVEPHCLVATSAGEVGIDLTCSRMITDMSSAASMVQRFGRANRFAEVDAVEIFVVFNSKDKKLKAYLWGDNDLDFIKSLDGDASCLNLYNKREELAALAKKVSVVPALEPNILNILSMTSLKHDIDISDYLRGKDLQSRYVEIAWRKEVDLLESLSVKNLGLESE